MYSIWVFSLANSPADRKFACQCGATRCERVVVKRPSGSDYTTDFVYCASCRTVFYWPDNLPSPNAETFATYGTGQGSGHPALEDCEFMASIQAAAESARKSRRWRR